MTRIVALTEGCGFARATSLPQLPLNQVGVEDLQGYDLVLMCPETLGNQAPNKIMAWKAAGRIGARLRFGTYKGIHYHQSSRRSCEHAIVVDGWVVHTRSEIARTGDDRLHFIPLAINQPANETAPTDRVFCGGRKKRDFDLAGQAVKRAGVASVFVSDVLPGSIVSRGDRYVIRRMVPQREYLDAMASCWLTLVPVEVGDYSHGHSDVVRSLLLGRPVIATKGGSCDDYIQDGLNGYLVEPDAEAWAEAIRRAGDNRESLMRGARESASRHTMSVYDKAVQAWCLSEADRRA